MKKIILPLALIVVSIAGIYLYHGNKLSNALSENDELVLKQEQSYRNKLDLLKSKFVEENPNESYLFDQLYNEEKSISFANTSVSTLFLEDFYEKKLVDEKYISCVYEKAQSEAINKRTEDIYNEQLAKLELKHGQIVYTWASELGKEMFVNTTHRNECSPYFPDNNFSEINYASFSEFDRFLDEFKINSDEIQAQNETNLAEFERELKALKKGLNGDASELFDQTINETTVMSTTNKRYEFNWKGHGVYTYTIPLKEMNNNSVEVRMDQVYREQYKNYSLSSGAMPYDYCYGRGNSGSSSVKVNAGSSDVIVTIKNMRDQVVRHVYIKSYRSYTLNVPNGQYTVYFYSGSGWNPKRFMKDTDCGRLVGGFLSNESVSKDPTVLRLNYQIMEYTLTQSIGGNFSTSGSSKLEAF